MKVFRNPLLNGHLTVLNNGMLYNSWIRMNSLSFTRNDIPKNLEKSKYNLSLANDASCLIASTVLPWV